MANLSKRTPHLDARILKLAAKGLSLRKIEAQLALEGTPCSHNVVGQIIREYRDREAAGTTEIAPVAVETAEEPLEAVKRAVRGKTGAPKVPAPVSESGELPLPDLPEHASLAARMVYQELIEVRGVARTFYQRVEDGDAPLNAWTQAKQHVLRLIKQLEEMVPAPPADPSKDPMAIACREMTHGQLLQAIRVAQAQLGHLCPACRSETMAAHG